MYLYLLTRKDRENGNRISPAGRSQAPAGRSQDSELLVRNALRDYCTRQGLKPDAVWSEVTIDREAKGKPFFRGLSYESGAGISPVHFSVSHSGSWWGCLMSHEPVGFDLEVCREKVDYLKIARRFFTEEEYELVRSGSSDTFFDIWVRKEAFVKFTGAGLGEGLSSFSVAAGGKYSDEVIFGKNGSQAERTCFIRSYEIADGVKAAYCSTSGDTVTAVITMDFDTIGKAD